MPRPRSLAGAGVALAAVLLTAVPASGLLTGASAQEADPLGKDLSAIIADPSLAGADVGLSVRRADTGEVLFTSQSSRRSAPASNTKLVTSAAVVDILGLDHRFSTTVRAGGDVRGGVLGGDLYLRGTGDPTMLAADYDALAAKVAASGIRLVRGKLVADDTWFDSVRLGTGWSWDDEPYYYDGQISALTVSPDTDYDAGSIIVKVAPGTPGKPAKVTTEPPTGFVTIANTAVTGAAGSEASVNVERQHATNVISVSGSIPAGGAVDEEWSTVADPTGLVASLFRDALTRHGVRVLGATGTGATPANARQFADHQSMPLSQLLTPFLKLSNNMHAEILVKTAGRVASGEGSWDAGLEAISGKLGGLGIDPATLSLVDGSGLSRMDQLAPDQVTSLLLAAQTKPWFHTWYDALPIAGAADRMVGGTLRSRMKGTPAENNLHGKTGSLTGVSALSGYVTTADGVPLVFSMISNNTLGSPKALEDAVGVRLASNRDGQAVQRAQIAPNTVTDLGRQGANRRADLECSWLKAC